MEKETFNFDQRAVKQELYAFIATLKGLHEVTIEPKRDTRRARANAYYWAATVKLFQDFLAAQGQPHTKLQCHRMLGIRIAPIEVFDPTNGELMATLSPETSKMDIPTFYKYVNGCNEWLWDAFAIDVPPPRLYGAFEKEAA